MQVKGSLLVIFGIFGAVNAGYHTTEELIEIYKAKLAKLQALKAIAVQENKQKPCHTKLQEWKQEGLIQILSSKILTNLNFTSIICLKSFIVPDNIRKIRYLMSAACSFWNIKHTQMRIPEKSEICKHGRMCGDFMRKIRFISSKIDALESDDRCRSHFEIECIKNANGFESELVSMNQKDFDSVLPLQ